MLTVAKITRAAAAGYADYLEGKAQAAELGDYYLKDGERVEAPGRWAAGADAGRAAIRSVPVTRGAAAGADGGPPSGHRRAAAAGRRRAVRRSRRWTRRSPRRSRSARCGRSPTRSCASGSSARTSRRSTARSAYAVRAGGDDPPARRARTRDPRASRRRWSRRAGGTPPPGRSTAGRRTRSCTPTCCCTARSGATGGSWRSTRASWLVHRRELGAAYRTELARELNQLGFEIRRGTGRGGRYFEIAGVPTALLDRWSSRHHQVQAAIRATPRRPGDRAQAIIAGGGPDADRRAPSGSSSSIGTGQLAAARGAADDRGDPQPRSTARHPPRPRRALATTPAGAHAAQPLRSRAAALAAAASSRRRAAPELLERLTEFDATFPARDARAVALERSAGAPIDDAARTAARAASSRRDPRARRRERHHPRAPRARATDGRDRRAVSPRATVAPLAAAVIAQETERLDRELAAAAARLSDEQREAIELALRHPAAGGDRGARRDREEHHPDRHRPRAPGRRAADHRHQHRRARRRATRARAHRPRASDAARTPPPHCTPRSRPSGSGSAPTRRSSTTRPRSPRPASSSSCSRGRGLGRAADRGRRPAAEPARRRRRTLAPPRTGRPTTPTRTSS